MKKLILASALAGRIAAVVVPEPQITAAPLFPREYIRTLGWYASTATNGSTMWEPWAYDSDRTTYSTSSTWFRRCPENDKCSMFTSCSSGYLMAKGASSYCGRGRASDSSYFCSNHILYHSSGDPKPYFWYWCDKPPLTGSIFYEIKPTVPASVLATVTVPAGPTSSSAEPSSNSGGSHAGVIAGAVVGGILGLALIGAAVFLILRRQKRKEAVQHHGDFKDPGYQRYSQVPPNDGPTTGNVIPVEAPGNSIPYDPHQTTYFSGSGMKGDATTKYAHQAEPGEAFGGELPGSEPQPPARTRTVFGGEMPTESSPVRPHVVNA